MDYVDIDALFLGPKSENREYLVETLSLLIDEHVYWRRDFHPEDSPIVSRHRRRDEAYEATLERTSAVLDELSARLRATSMPWFSPRYLGHMNADTLLAANLAHMATVLYNPNNVAYESAPATTDMELEVGKQFADLFGLPDGAWGHVTADGTIANYEGLWLARNLASAPLAVSEVAPELVDGMDAWDLKNLPPDRALDLLDEARDAGMREEVRRHTVRGTGVERGRLGKVLVPESRHYSLAKAVDLLGLGHDSLVPVDVDEEYRMNTGALAKEIDRLVEDDTPILAVVPVVGSTEEGAVDAVHEVVALREDCEDRGVSFAIHADAAYGGYARTAFVDDDGEYLEFDQVKEELHDREIVDEDTDWPPRHVYDAYEALSAVDSITVDPHKMGYVPYAAGGFVVRDERVLDLASYTAPYVLAEDEDVPAQLGSYILEGSKSGATAAAVWAAHCVVPLSVGGYGQLVGQGVEGAHRFFDSLISAGRIEAGGMEFAVEPLVRPDLNIVDFAFNEVDNDDLGAMNELNRTIYEQSSYRSGPVYTKEFITSKTTLDAESYGDVPARFAATLGVPESEWADIQAVTVLRSCVLTPHLAYDSTYEEYWETFMETIQEKLAQIAEGSVE